MFKFNLLNNAYKNIIIFKNIYIKYFFIIISLFAINSSAYAAFNDDFKINQVNGKFELVAANSDDAVLVYGDEFVGCFITDKFNPLRKEQSYPDGNIACMGVSSDSNECRWAIYTADGADVEGDKEPFPYLKKETCYRHLQYKPLVLKASLFNLVADAKGVDINDKHYSKFQIHQNAEGQLRLIINETPTTIYGYRNIGCRTTGANFLKHRYDGYGDNLIACFGYSHYSDLCTWSIYSSAGKASYLYDYKLKGQDCLQSPFEFEYVNKSKIGILQLEDFGIIKKCSVDQDCNNIKPDQSKFVGNDAYIGDLVNTGESLTFSAQFNDVDKVFFIDHLKNNTEFIIKSSADDISIKKTVSFDKPGIYTINAIGVPVDKNSEFTRVTWKVWVQDKISLENKQRLFYISKTLFDPKFVDDFIDFANKYKVTGILPDTRYSGQRVIPSLLNKIINNTNVRKIVYKVWGPYSKKTIDIELIKSIIDESLDGSLEAEILKHSVLINQNINIEFVINYEHEHWWHYDDDKQDLRVKQDYLNKLKKITSKHNWRLSTYEYYLLSGKTEQEKIDEAMKIIKDLDEVYLTIYHHSSLDGFKTQKQRLITYSKAAKNLGKTIDIYPLIAVFPTENNVCTAEAGCKPGDSIKIYGLDAIERKFLVDYANNEEILKDHINIKGFAYFQYPYIVNIDIVPDCQSSQDCVFSGGQCIDSKCVKQCNNNKDCPDHSPICNISTKECLGCIDDSSCQDVIVNSMCSRGGIKAGQCVLAGNIRCGDGLLTGYETCDDGNQVSNDGCSSSCRIEPGYICEIGAFCTLIDKTLLSDFAIKKNNDGMVLTIKGEEIAKISGDEFVGCIDTGGFNPSGNYEYKSYIGCFAMSSDSDKCQWSIYWPSGAPAYNYTEYKYGSKDDCYKIPNYMFASYGEFCSDTTPCGGCGPDSCKEGEECLSDGTCALSTEKPSDYNVIETSESKETLGLIEPALSIEQLVSNNFKINNVIDMLELVAETSSKDVLVYGDEFVGCFITDKFNPLRKEQSYPDGNIACMGVSRDSNECRWAIYTADGADVDGDKEPFPYLKKETCYRHLQYKPLVLKASLFNLVSDVKGVDINDKHYSKFQIHQNAEGQLRLIINETPTTIHGYSNIGCRTTGANFLKHIYDGYGDNLIACFGYSHYSDVCTWSIYNGAGKAAYLYDYELKGQDCLQSPFEFEYVNKSTIEILQLEDLGIIKKCIVDQDCNNIKPDQSKFVGNDAYIGDLVYVGGSIQFGAQFANVDKIYFRDHLNNDSEFITKSSNGNIILNKTLTFNKPGIYELHAVGVPSSGDIDYKRVTWKVWVQDNVSLENKERLFYVNNTLFDQKFVDGFIDFANKYKLTGILPHASYSRQRAFPELLKKVINNTDVRKVVYQVFGPYSTGDISIDRTTALMDESLENSLESEILKHAALISQDTDIKFVINYEHEHWWHYDDDKQDLKIKQDYLDKLKKITSKHNWRLSTYEYYLKSGNTEQQKFDEAIKIIKDLDEVYLTIYHRSSLDGFKTQKQRLITYSKAAKKLGKTIDIYPLIGVFPTENNVCTAEAGCNPGDSIKIYGLDAIERKFLVDYANNEEILKDHINIKGFAYFQYPYIVNIDIVPDCQSNQDCVFSGGQCIDSKCVIQCNDNKDCPEHSPICNIGTKKCLGCIDDSSCQDVIVNSMCSHGGVKAGQCVLAGNIRCGDGLLTGYETCDDGNHVSDDGCSSSCKIEPGYICERGAFCTLIDKTLLANFAIKKNNDGMVLTIKGEEIAKISGDEFVGCIDADGFNPSGNHEYKSYIGCFAMSSDSGKCQWSIYWPSGAAAYNYTEYKYGSKDDCYKIPNYIFASYGEFCSDKTSCGGCSSASCKDGEICLSDGTCINALGSACSSDIECANSINWKNNSDIVDRFKVIKQNGVLKLFVNSTINPVQQNWRKNQVAGTERIGCIITPTGYSIGTINYDSNLVACFGVNKDNDVCTWSVFRQDASFVSNSESSDNKIDKNACLRQGEFDFDILSTDLLDSNKRCKSGKCSVFTIIPVDKKPLIAEVVPAYKKSEIPDVIPAGKKRIIIPSIKKYSESLTNTIVAPKITVPVRKKYCNRFEYKIPKDNNFGIKEARHQELEYNLQTFCNNISNETCSICSNIHKRNNKYIKKYKSIKKFGELLNCIYSSLNAYKSDLGYSARCTGYPDLSKYIIPNIDKFILCGDKVQPKDKQYCEDIITIMDPLPQLPEHPVPIETEQFNKSVPVQTVDKKYCSQYNFIVPRNQNFGIKEATQQELQYNLHTFCKDINAKTCSICEKIKKYTIKQGQLLNCVYSSFNTLKPGLGYSTQCSGYTDILEHIKANITKFKLCGKNVHVKDKQLCD